MIRVVFRTPTGAMAHAVLLATVVVLAACEGASRKWINVDVGEKAMAVDLDQCDMIGLAAGLSASLSKTFYVSVTSTGDLVETQLPGIGALFFMKKVDAFDSCMEARGYKLPSNTESLEADL